jgi:hypothetical protein
VDAVKEVVSVSIGSSKRDHEVEIELLGEQFRIRREGTDGNMEKARRRLAELDGTVDALGIGGTDLFMRFDGHDYYIRDIKKIVADIKERKPDAEVTFESHKEGYGRDYRKVLSETQKVLAELHLGREIVRIEPKRASLIRRPFREAVFLR